MRDESAQTLFYPFGQDMLESPTHDQACAFINPPMSFKHDCIHADTDILSYYKSVCDDFEKRGHNVMQDLDSHDYYDFIFLCAPKQKEEAYFFIALAFKALKDGGCLMVAAMNDAGGKRLPKMMKEFGVEALSETKNKARVIWVHKKNINSDVVHQYYNAGLMQSINIYDMPTKSRAGIYGWNKIDVGSKLLLDTLPDLSGNGADFGCGYGYLSRAIMQGNPEIKALYAIDIDWRSVQACKENVPNVVPIWADLKDKPEGIKSLDWIVMNPPFHEGKVQNIDLGRSFIETAAAMLRKNGALYMVANKHLPYEDVLNKLFFKVEKLIEKDGFKVFKAVR